MIDQVDTHVSEWIKGILSDINVSLAAPKPSQTDRGVSLYLLELKDKPAPRSNTRPPLQIELRYLITAWANEPEQAHSLLGQLIFAAMGNTDFEVDLEPLPAATWTAFGVPPQPSFILVVPLRQDRPEPATKLVRKPMVLQTSSIVSLRGVVLGPEDTPIVNARVEIPMLQLYELTDTRGRFRFASVPDNPRKKLLRVRAKGRALDVNVEPTDSEPVVIHFDVFD